ncbi:GyrI-like domain-containing protein [Pontibacter sp. Tf4]|uniref:GyrI-like domain-containing protein n=1 Tax=Pontibacter sp. Tf4 TaxID=2761620 RepID=UPI001625430B|nr:GyrI-like domain-containing protein [Pontibacter sp. Tf4]MBB6609941.1 GyrI-like domain-containing protein [Pontibacter sp. Tf4]
MQQPTLQTIAGKKLVGMSTETKLATHNPATLWQQFMPRRHEVGVIVGPELYSVQVYDAGFVKGEFTANSVFRDWAAVEVTDSTDLPDGMEQLNVPAGLYAVFLHKGPASAFPATAGYIFGEWLPNSNYTLDDRPHFEVMGAKYLGHEHPDSEEEVWIPVKLRLV